MNTLSVKVKGVSASGHTIEVTRSNNAYTETADLMKRCGYKVYVNPKGKFKLF